MHIRHALPLFLAAASLILGQGTLFAQSTEAVEPAQEVDVRALFGVDDSGEPVSDPLGEPETVTPPAPAPAVPQQDAPVTVTPQEVIGIPDAGTTIPAPDTAEPTDTPTSLSPETVSETIPATVPADPNAPAAAEAPTDATTGAPTGAPTDAPAESAEPEEEAIPDPVKTWENRPVVKMRALDKVTARTMTFEAKVGSVARFGDLFIKVQACREPDAIFTPESAAFLQIWQVPAGQEESVWVFSGWMFATSPALSGMDHPIYDVWVMDCLDPNAPKPPKADDISKEAAPAPATQQTPAEAEEEAPAD